MNGVPVDEDRMTFLAGTLAKALQKYENNGCLGIMKACVHAEHDIIGEDVDVGDLVRVEGRD